MSNKTDKLKKIKKNVLNRHEWDEKAGVALINDFMQLSKIAENLKETDEQAYNAYMSLIKTNVELQEECMERGKRLGRLAKQEAKLRKADREKHKKGNKAEK